MSREVKHRVHVVVLYTRRPYPEYLPGGSTLRVAIEEGVRYGITLKCRPGDVESFHLYVSSVLCLTDRFARFLLSPLQGMLLTMPGIDEAARARHPGPCVPSVYNMSCYQPRKAPFDRPTTVVANYEFSLIAHPCGSGGPLVEPGARVAEPVVWPLLHRVRVGRAARGRPFVFRPWRADDGRVMDGMLDAVEAVKMMLDWRDVKLTGFVSDDYLNLPPPFGPRCATCHRTLRSHLSWWPAEPETWYRECPWCCFRCLNEEHLLEHSHYTHVGREALQCPDCPAMYAKWRAKMQSHGYRPEFLFPQRILLF